MSGCHGVVAPGFADYSVYQAFFYRKSLQMACSLEIYKWKANFTGFMRTFNILSVLTCNFTPL